MPNDGLIPLIPLAPLLPVLEPLDPSYPTWSNQSGQTAPIPEFGGGLDFPPPVEVPPVPEDIPFGF
jgi:hypothetical protein